MADISLRQSPRRRYRRYSNDSEDQRPRNHHRAIERSSERYPSHSDRGVRERSQSDAYNKRRSRSPRMDRFRSRSRSRRRGSRRERSPESASPGRGHRDYGEDSRHSRRDRSTSRSRSPKRWRHNNSDDRDRSPHHHRPRALPSPPPPTKRSAAPLPSQKAAFQNEPTTSTTITNPSPETEKQKPNYAPTGKLAAETNTVANTSIILKYNEPPESRLPPHPYNLYIFKGPSILETLPLSTRTCWLFGRERAVVDCPTEHPSCSKQHAVLQFRYVEKRDEWGERRGGVRLYVIDLESANGTRVNGEVVPERRYVEVRSGDVVTFGESTREYVVMVPPKEEKKS